MDVGQPSPLNACIERERYLPTPTYKSFRVPMIPSPLSPLPRQRSVMGRGLEKRKKRHLVDLGPPDIINIEVSGSVQVRPALWNPPLVPVRAAAPTALSPRFIQAEGPQKKKGAPRDVCVCVFASANRRIIISCAAFTLKSSPPCLIRTAREEARGRGEGGACFWCSENILRQNSRSVKLVEIVES